MFENLLLTSRHQMEVLQKIQEYFEKRCATSKYPGLIEEDQITKFSFAARFAKRNGEMQAIKAGIQTLDEEEIKEKLKEVEKAREKLAKDRARANKKTCVCDEEGEQYCVKCKLLKKIENFRIGVHRSLMMPEEHDQNAVAFELRIPDVIACLRDTLYVFLAHYDQSLPTWSKQCVQWVKHDNLSDFYTGCAENLFLGTNCDYFNKRVGRTVNHSRHPDTPDSLFINKNASDYNCLICGTSETGEKVTKMPTKTEKHSIKNFVTLSVEKLSVYKNLQWTLESTKHTQNKVLATQSECPANLSTAEYINFGLLRADGHRLQYRNLYRMIADDSLSFETPSVVALVMQTLWETGPGSTNWYREANEDFVDLGFVQALIDLLRVYIGIHRENWKNPFKLLVAILVICRLYEINSDAAVTDDLAQMLVEFRLIAQDWIERIHETIQRDCTERERSNLHSNLRDAALCGIFTYFVSQNHIYFEKIFEYAANRSAVFTWLRFIETINNNNLLYNNGPQVRISISKLTTFS